jgi:protein-disulfide isomerase
LKEFARTLKLDEGAFDRCVDSGERAGRVRVESAEFEGLGLTGTPTFFVNGRMVSGVLGYEAFRALIEEEIGSAGSRCLSGGPYFSPRR